MDDAITESDKLKLIEFISSNDIHTCGKKVEEFENEWSRWLGCEHSLFVTSGSTAFTSHLSCEGTLQNP